MDESERHVLETYERHIRALYEENKSKGEYRGDPRDDAMIYILQRLKNIHMFDSPHNAEIHIRRIKGKLK